jgi:hypothetical protein
MAGVDWAYGEEDALLNEFLKTHGKMENQDRKIHEQESTIAELKSGMKALAATVNEQASQIQKSERTA